MNSKGTKLPKKKKKNEDKNLRWRQTACVPQNWELCWLKLAQFRPLPWLRAKAKRRPEAAAARLLESVKDIRPTAAVTHVAAVQMVGHRLLWNHWAGSALGLPSAEAMRAIDYISAAFGHNSARQGETVRG